MFVTSSRFNLGDSLRLEGLYRRASKHKTSFVGRCRVDRTLKDFLWWSSKKSIILCANLFCQRLNTLCGTVLSSRPFRDLSTCLDFEILPGSRNPVSPVNFYLSLVLLRTIRAYWSKRRVVTPVLFRTNYYSVEIPHGVTAISLTYHPHHAKLQVLPFYLPVGVVTNRQKCCSEAFEIGLILAFFSTQGWLIILICLHFFIENSRILFLILFQSR